jgi:hypothetical protein
MRTIRREDISRPSIQPILVNMDSWFRMYCLNVKHRMGVPKGDGMNRRRRCWMRWSLRQLQPGLDIGA